MQSPNEEIAAHLIDSLIRETALDVIRLKTGN